MEPILLLSHPVDSNDFVPDYYSIEFNVKGGKHVFKESVENVDYREVTAPENFETDIVA